MSKYLFFINGKYFFVDDKTGKILTLHIADEEISPKDHDDLIKAMAKRLKPDEENEVE